MKINPAYFALAAKLQEAASAMSHEDIQQRLRDALNDKYRGTGTWAYLVAVFGDDKSGKCVYSCNSDLMQADYTCSKTGATINTDAAVDVVPLTTYHAEPAEGLTEAGRRNSARDLSQLQAIHDAAMSLGATCAMKEAKAPVAADLKLVESAGGFLADIPLREARTSYPIKIISPGTGSTAHYSAKMLEESADKFAAGTLMFWNHPTAAEESARPEGDLNNLAAITTSPARWDANGVKGPGLYAEAKVMADYAEKVAERAPHIGLSIRAGGTGTGKLVDGKPELKSIDYVESVDYVTKAGRGGLALAEAARNAGLIDQEVSMTDADVQKLVESAVTKAVAETLAQATTKMNVLESRALRGDAREEATRLLESVTLPPASKARVIESVLRDVPAKDGALDTVEFGKLVEAAAKAEGAYVTALTGAGTPRGMGVSAPQPIDAKEAERQAAEFKLQEARDIEVWKRLLPEGAAKHAAKGRVA